MRKIIGKPLVVIHLSGSADLQLPDKLIEIVSDKGRNIVTIEKGGFQMGASNVRYYYSDDDLDLAKRVDLLVVNALQESNIEIPANGIPVASLSGMQMKPPKGTIDVWLNMSNGKAL